MKKIAVALLLFATGTAGALERELPPLKDPSLGATRIAAIRKAMDAYVFRDVAFHDAPLRDAVSFLMLKLRRTDEFEKSGKAFSYILNFGTDGRVAEEAKVSLVAKSITLPEAIDHICQQAGLYWRCDGKISILAKDVADRDTTAP